MNLTLENNIYSLLASARASFASSSEEQSARTGQPLAPTPSDAELINDAPPLAQEIEAIKAQENATVTNIAANSNTPNTGNFTSTPNKDSSHSDVNNSVAGGNKSSILYEHDALIGKLNIVA